jgi:hypothetical protein
MSSVLQYSDRLSAKSSSFGAESKGLGVISDPARRQEALSRLAIRAKAYASGVVWVTFTMLFKSI